MEGRRPRSLLRLARWALEWEWLWPALWPSTALLGTFLVIALFDVLPELPGWLHALVLLGLVAALGVTLRRVRKAHRRVGGAAARRRLERDSGLPHHPLEALEDRLAAGAEDPAAQAIWAVHRGRMARTVQRLRVRLPRAGLAAHDPRAWRALLLLLLVVGAVAAGGDAGPRIGRALLPGVSTRVGSAAPVRVEAWLTPQAYTGQPPRLLKGGEGHLTVPAGSGIVVHLSGAGASARLRIGNQAHPLTALGAESFRGEAAIETGETLAVDLDDRAVVTWPMQVIADTPPVVEWTASPEVSSDARLRLPYAARDDYGMTGLVLEARLAGEDGEEDDDPEDVAQIIRQDIAMPAGDRRLVQGAAGAAFAQHPWRGRRVAITLIGQDARRQRGESPTVVLKLPERVFLHPVARQLAELRARLRDDRARRLEVAEGLAELAQSPARYDGDVVVHLALAVGQGRLLRDLRPEGVRTVKALLWDVALRLEDGGRALAERDVQAARRALEQALADGADGATLDGLIENLREAMERYLAALARELDRQGRSSETGTTGEIFDAEALGQFLDQLQAMAQQGATEAARRMLAELQALLNELETQVQRPPPKPEDVARAKALSESLRDLTRRQQELTDRAFRRLPEDPELDDPSPSPEAKADNQGAAVAQDGLRRDLDAVIRDLGELVDQTPSALSEAGKAMAEAVENLRGNQLRSAVDAQARALDALRRGQGEAGQAMAQALGGPGLRLGPPGPGGSERRWGNAPFGRGGSADSGAVKLPTDRELGRARALLDELRRRMGDPGRSDEEQRYLERLLKRF